ncbi:hypothetical protein A2960_04920 [Candidatus Gottesmanbacteria bacterium RIFCSPLOWO2_01_FULL_39_12b]|uniref:DUF948 domain-containing protein n=1 Tax=Candidatus Gottesmanbacteria bacterium RIFCSPLOWO2_01_FULL_39_12b TaxID=1798388 RepID=A0A1F6APS1_9BACT|nr:MAG: hypothetical protein A2960_04920 [Candidatus Gottesmanbacteria bacterium RIFCSPLOWO2_01_FULL_39_12b]
MLEPTQVLLFAVVIVLTILMVIVGWQIFLILSEIRKMLMKFNSMAEQAVNVSTSLGKSLQNISGFSEGLKAFFSVLGKFKKKDTPLKKEMS